MMKVRSVTLKKQNTKKLLTLSCLEGVRVNVKHFIKANNVYVCDNKLLQSAWIFVTNSFPEPK